MALQNLSSNFVNRVQPLAIGCDSKLRHDRAASSRIVIELRGIAAVALARPAGSPFRSQRPWHLLELF
jgi:hypothetical protein